MNIIKQIPYLQDLPFEQQALIVIIATPILVWLVALLIRTVVLRFVMAPVRSYASKTDSELDDRVLHIIERPLRLFMIGIAIAIISALLAFQGDIDALADNIANALILASIILFVYNLVDVFSVTSDNLRNLTGIQVEERLLPFLRVVAKVVVVVIGLLIIVQEFGYSITGLVASFGIVGLAISLAAQDTAANVIGFTSIVSDNPFQVGDYIVTGDIAGTVEEVGVRTTRVRKLDQSLVTLPNSTLTSAAVTNWSRLDRRRLDFYIGVTYNTTSEQMRALLNSIGEMLKGREHVDEESVIVHFTEFGDSALKIRVIAYVLLADWGEFTTEQELINLEIMQIAESLGVSMAFPTTSVYIENAQQDNIAQSLPGIPPPRPTEQDNVTDEGIAEAKFQDNEAASSDTDSGDAK